MTRTTVPASTRPPQRYTVSQRHDPAEAQAHRVADVVARGGSVAGWSFSAVPTRGSVHRDESGTPKTEDEKYKEAAGKIGEAALDTPTGKKLQETVREDPLVKQATQFLDTPAGKVAAGVALAGTVAGLAFAGQPLPVQAPAIPLDRITPGLSAKVTVQGPLDAPTFVGFSLSYKEQGPKSGRDQDQKEKYRAETARLKASLALPKSTADVRAEEAELARIIAGQRLLGSTALIPLRPSDRPKTVNGPPAERAVDTELKKPDDAPVQRDPAPGGLAASGGLDTSAVEGVVSGGGRRLDPSLRRTMEARFGYDFGSVRLHDDARAHAAAHDVEANAFTVGDHIAFAPGRFAPQSPEGAHVLAHELAHVVQQRGGNSPVHRPATVQRAGLLESISRLLGGGTFTTEELTAYLQAIQSAGQIEDNYDSDNKAREIVRRFVSADPIFALLTIPDRVLLIKEMLSGFAGNDDEQAILELLREATPPERMAIGQQIGVPVLRSAFHGEELGTLNELLESAEEEAGLDALTVWTVDGILDILERHGDASVIRSIVQGDWKIIRFDTAFDTWRYKSPTDTKPRDFSGRVEKTELKGLQGNTERETKKIRIRNSLTNQQATETLFHEMHHAVAPEAQTQDEALEGEIAARVASELFNIRHGLPPSGPHYRRPDGTVDEEFIRKQIKSSPHYNPTNRKRIGRQYVGDRPTSGWRIRPAAARKRGTP